MIGAIVERRMWAAFLFFLIFGPVLGMLYLNRGLMALGYLAAVLGAMVWTVLWLPPDAEAALEALLTLIVLIGIGHGMAVAWRREPDEPLRWYARWPGFLSLLSIPALLVLVRFTVLEPYSLPSHAMSPTLNQGDLFLTSRHAYISGTPQRGDLIVFNTPEGTPFVKRVIGLQGDKVQMKEGVLYLNDEPVERKEIEPFPIVHGLPMGNDPQFIETLPGGKSHATLSHGGRSILESTGVYQVANGCLFVMGDNRPNSHDSRMPDMSCVAEEDVVGKVWLRYWNGRTRSLVLEYPE